MDTERAQRLAWFREARFGMMITWGIYALEARPMGGGQAAAGQAAGPAQCAFPAGRLGSPGQGGCGGHSFGKQSQADCEFPHAAFKP